MKLIFYFLSIFNLITLNLVLNIRQNRTIKAELPQGLDILRNDTNCSVENCKSCINKQCNSCLENYILNENKCYSKYLFNNFRFKGVE